MSPSAVHVSQRLTATQDLPRLASSTTAMRRSATLSSRTDGGDGASAIVAVQQLLRNASDTSGHIASATAQRDILGNATTSVSTVLPGVFLGLQVWRSATLQCPDCLQL